MDNLWSKNHPRNFWLLQVDPPEKIWQEAIHKAIPILLLPIKPDNVETILALTLGEGQFGPQHFQLSSSKQLYYSLKPFLPRYVINQIKSANARKANKEFSLQWPIEDRFAHFQWEIIRQIMILTSEDELTIHHFWPRGNRFALVLTHDIETAKGQTFVRKVADLEENLGFRSSFNFVPERYQLDYQLINDLSDRGFEVGIHGLKHDGKLFRSENTFKKRSLAINSYFEELDAVGFRSPLMHRNPEWMQSLNIEYDLSFFDTDPFEPMAGGCMTIWPFTIGRFVELPYTLVQDSTLGFVLGETTPRIWLDKLEFIKSFWGMALLNTHPDYLIDSNIWVIYQEFLQTIKDQHNYWHALPREVARWWRYRFDSSLNKFSGEITLGTLSLENDDLVINGYQ